MVELRSKYEDCLQPTLSKAQKEDSIEPGDETESWKTIKMTRVGPLALS